MELVKLIKSTNQSIPQNFYKHLLVARYVDTAEGGECLKLYDLNSNDVWSTSRIVDQCYGCGEIRLYTENSRYTIRKAVEADLPTL